MKKIFAIVLSLIMALSLASCGDAAPECTASLGDIYAKITESIDMPYEKLELSADDLLDYYGIDGSKFTEVVAVQDACGYKDEIVMLKAADEAAAAEAVTALNEHIEYQKETMKNYDPAQYEILTSSKVEAEGLWVAMFISGSQDEMTEIYYTFFK